MARNDIGLKGIGVRALTLHHDASIVYDPTAESGNSAQAGLAVKLVSDSTVGLASTGDAVYGRVTIVGNDGKCTVDRVGIIDFKAGDGATFTSGQGVVGAKRGGDDGYVNGSASGTGAIIDSSDSDAVFVDMG